MRRRLIAILLAGPPTLAGSFAAHQLGYSLAGADAQQRLLAAAGHGYLGHAPTVLLALVSVLAVAALLAVIAENRERPQARIAAWPVLLIAPAAFLLQEYFERLAAGQPVLDTLAQPAVLWGFALQLPFAVLAWVVALFVCASARALGRRLRRARPGRGSARSDAPQLRQRSVRWRRPSPLAGCAAGRAPPAVLLLR